MIPNSCIQILSIVLLFSISSVAQKSGNLPCIYVHPIDKGHGAIPDHLISDMYKTVLNRLKDYHRKRDYKGFSLYSAEEKDKFSTIAKSLSQDFCERHGICNENFTIPPKANIIIIGKIDLFSEKFISTSFTCYYIDLEEILSRCDFPPDPLVELTGVINQNNGFDYINKIVNNCFEDLKMNQLINRFHSVRLGAIGPARLFKDSIGMDSVVVMENTETDRKKLTDNLLPAKGYNSDTSKIQLDTIANKDNSVIVYTDSSDFKIQDVLFKLNSRNEDCYNKYKASNEFGNTPSLRHVQNWYDKDYGYLVLDIETILKILRNGTYIENVHGCLEDFTEENLTSKCWTQFEKDPSKQKQLLLENINMFEKYSIFDARKIKKDALGNYIFFSTKPGGKKDFNDTWYAEVRERKENLCNELIKILNDYPGIRPSSKLLNIDEKIKWIETQLLNGKIPTHENPHYGNSIKE